MPISIVEEIWCKGSFVLYFSSKGTKLLNYDIREIKYSNIIVGFWPFKCVFWR